MMHHLRSKRVTYLVVIGQNGACKSTLFRCMIDFFDDYQGSISYEGMPIKDITIKKICSIMYILIYNMIYYQSRISFFSMLKCHRL